MMLLEGDSFREINVASTPTGINKCNFLQSCTETCLSNFFILEFLERPY